jgi:hypothetical protein
VLSLTAETALLLVLWLRNFDADERRQLVATAEHLLELADSAA